jgi:periplasmic copper chaperone A
VKRITASLAVLVLAAITVSACSSSTGAAAKPQLAVIGAYVPQPPLQDMAAGYFTITNTGGASDKLVGVSSDAATDVSMHITTASEQMQQVSSWTIPAGGKLVLGTGGNHLMLMGLERKLTAGQKVTFVLHFASSPTITVSAPVEPADYQPMAMNMPMG